MRPMDEQLAAGDENLNPRFAAKALRARRRYNPGAKRALALPGR